MAFGIQNIEQEDHRPTKRIRVLLVDDHAMVRQGLRKYLNHCADMELIGEATDGAEAVHLADQFSPDVVLMDMNMPRLNGIEATSLIKSKHPSMQIIGLSFDQKPKNRTAFLKAGARVVLDKGTAHQRLQGVISRVVQNRMVSPVAASGEHVEAGQHPCLRETASAI
ncbi:MAG: hypothetical protein Nkreftii_000101 [Candidatus Nitrospira kreftii]|uniref:Response regulatory domain-containing protein n=1 Tax=Candidatus Nitrospira kreftii TaxID=2652173 RepID=A0A7S8IVQ1_9BACT|nr:MAG: hypothetical protein Nkreftii_000101 [Candidatus Nitrospira kreftii]